MQDQLKKESTVFITEGPCVYHIHNPLKTGQGIRGNGGREKRSTLFSFDRLNISITATQGNHLCFADVYCGKIILSDFVQHLLRNETLPAVLTESPDGVFLDQHLLIQKKGITRRELLSILIEHAKQYRNEENYPYMELEEIEKLLHQKTGIDIYDIKSQIYIPLYKIHKRAQKLNSCNLIEFKPKKVRISPSIFCV